MDVEPGKVDNRFLNCVKDDLNIPGAIAELHHIASDINRKSELAASLNFLGLSENLGMKSQTISEDVRSMVENLKDAREAKNWELADFIRDEIRGRGIEVQILPDGAILIEKV